MDKILAAHKSGERPVGTELPDGWIKKRQQKGWLRDFKLCIFFPPTPKSEFKKALQAKEKEMRVGGREKFSINIIETAEDSNCKQKDCPYRHPKLCRNFSKERYCRFCEDCAYKHKDELNLSQHTESMMKHSQEIICVLLFGFRNRSSDIPLYLDLCLAGLTRA